MLFFIRNLFFIHRIFSLKNNILKDLHRIKLLKNSPSFFYDLVCRLTETKHHEECNIDAHLVSFCKKEQVLDLFSRWSITRLEQIDKSSPFYFKLIKYQPSVVIHLIRGDLNQIKTNQEIFLSYFQQKDKILQLLVNSQAKELVSLFIEHLNQVEKHQRFLPSIVDSKQVLFFRKAPEEMIELITIVASTQPGTIRYRGTWGGTSELSSFSFPRSFSIENYVQLFFALYDTCNWSSHHFIPLLVHMFENIQGDPNLSSMKKQRKWFWDILVNERIGKKVFLEKLLKDGDENILSVLKNYLELTHPLSVHLLSKQERDGIVEARQRLLLLHYQRMTKELFEQFLSLFKQTGSDVDQRRTNYPLFLRCAVSTNEQFAQDVLQWIEKRFTNEQLMVIEHFIEKLSSYPPQFHFEILPKNIKSIETIINLAINHLQRTTNTLRTVAEYGIFLLKRAEHYQNKEQKEYLQQFALGIIKQ